MVHIYYHIYAIDGVDEIIHEQLSLIEKHFDFPFILNIGVCIPTENISNSNILKKIYSFKKLNPTIRDVRSKGHEYITLDLIDSDKNIFNDSDCILYIHTKGASKQNDDKYDNVKSWRHLMNYFNIERVKNVFKLFEKTEFNTYGVLFGKAGAWTIYSGNFFWMRADYAKSLELSEVKKSSRYSAEHSFIQLGKNWKPYSLYNREGENHYEINFKREEYTK
jgi:hypothetical protein